jgi:hypothetical protein
MDQGLIAYRRGLRAVATTLLHPLCLFLTLPVQGLHVQMIIILIVVDPFDPFSSPQPAESFHESLCDQSFRRSLFFCHLFP